MRRRILKTLLYSAIVFALIAGGLWIYFHPLVKEKTSIGYTTRNGTELSYEVVMPRNQNGAAVLVLVSGS